MDYSDYACVYPNTRCCNTFMLVYLACMRVFPIFPPTPSIASDNKQFDTLPPIAKNESYGFALI